MKETRDTHLESRDISVATGRAAREGGDFDRGV